MINSPRGVIPPYLVKREGSIWLVVSASTGLIQFRSLRRINALDWLRANAPASPLEALQGAPATDK